MGANKEMEDYLISWFWEKEARSVGFDVWTHSKFPGRKYTIGGAYEKMKKIEPSADYCKLCEGIIHREDLPAETTPYDYLCMCSFSSQEEADRYNSKNQTTERHENPSLQGRRQNPQGRQ